MKKIFITNKKENFIRLYKSEKTNSLNYILGYPKQNNCFTKSELQIFSKLNLSNKSVVEWCKLIWVNRENNEYLDEIMNALNERRCPKCI